MDDSEYIAIAKRIKAMRELSDISADETAEKLGVSPEEYRSYENGEKGTPGTARYWQKTASRPKRYV